MASRTPQLRQSFLVTGAGVALVLVIAFATLSGNSAQRTAERQAQDLGQDAATRVATLVDQYLRERRHEAEALAASPAVVRAAIDAAQQATQEKLPRLDIPTLERMFAQRRALGGDADLVPALPEILVDQRRNPGRRVLAQVLRLPLRCALGAVPRQRRERDYQHQGDAGPCDEEALPELRGAAGHVVRVGALRYVGLLAGASLFNFMDL